MPALATVTAALEVIAPRRLAAEWDSVGLLVGAGPEIARVLTCLTLTPDVAVEAVQARADLVVTHHPLPFRPVPRITADTATGSVLLTLVRGGIGIWSSHTAWDSAAGGVNDQLAEAVGLRDVAPLEPDSLDPRVGFGRRGEAGTASLREIARRLADRLGIAGSWFVGDPGRPAGRVGIVCGSGGESVATVTRAGCTTLLTGELKLHHALEARAAGLAVVAVGHHASEHFSLAVLAARLAAAVPGLECLPSRVDLDPLAWHDVSRGPA